VSDGDELEAKARSEADGGQAGERSPSPPGVREGIRPGAFDAGPRPDDAEWDPKAWGVRPGFPRARVYAHPVKTRARGVAYGYYNAVRATTAAVEHDEASDVALHVAPAAQYKPDPDRLNVLLTMQESPTMAADDVAAFAQGLDWIVTPCTFCAEIYERAGWRGRVTIAPLAVRLGIFRPPAHRAKWPRLPFRWFWVGSTDPRKGQATALLAWRRFFAGRPEAELYLKATAPGSDGIERGGNIVMDWRNLPTDELAALYREADGFVFASAGEGYGFPLVEAMASGLPVVATTATATGDWVTPATGLAIPHVWKRLEVYKRPSQDEDGRYLMAIPSVMGTARAMARVMADYPSALERARSAHRMAGARARLDHYAAGLLEAVTAVRRKGARL